MKEFKVLGSGCWLAEVRPADLGVYVPERPVLPATAAQATRAPLVVSGTYFDPSTGSLCALLRGGGRAWGWQPAGRPLLSVTGGRARVLPAAADDPGADLVVGGGPVLVVGGRPAWRESYKLGRYTGLQPEKALPRVALGLTAGGAVVMVLVAEALTFQALAETLAAQGCSDAMALDGGGSAALVADGRLIFGGQRALPSVVIERAPAGGQPRPGASQPRRRLNDIRISPHFTLREFESPDTHEVKLQPELVDLLERIRARLGPVIVTSGTRSREHNQAVGGAEESTHMTGEGADIVAPPVPLEVVARVADEEGAVGIGMYTDHVHVDVRQGPAARWRG